jgi:trimeric autotransporter adhesin
MTKGTGNIYTATIPQQQPGSSIAYYIHAADQSKRSMDNPYIGKSDPHVFTVKSTSTIPPVAEFSASQTNITAGGKVQFTDLSTNVPTSWSWIFEGGTPATSNVQNPSVTYNTPGTYQVSLTAANSAGNDIETKVAYIVVNAAPLNYCASKSSNSSYEWIKSIQIGSFTNTSGAAGYTDFTTKTISVNPGSTISITLTPGFTSSSYNEFWKIWIDYNKDGDFTDSGEEVFSTSGKSAITGTFAVQNLSVSTRMRISMKYNATPTACETFSYGEVEDYNINIQTVQPVLNKSIELVAAEADENILKVQQNPVGETLLLNTKEIKSEIYIINSTGEVVEVKSLSGTNHSIDVSSYSKGLYTIYVIINGKLIKSKFMKL